MMLIAALALLTAGCSSDKPARVNAPPPGQTFQGEKYLHGTVGSMATLRGDQPTLVAGYGVVGALSNTGSSDVPPQLKQMLLSELKRQGFGSAKLGIAELTPETVLASETTAVVLLQGLIPPGAV